MISIRDPQTMLLPSRDTPACPAVQIVDYHPQPLTQPQASTSARDPWALLPPTSVTTRLQLRHCQAPDPGPCHRLYHIL